MLKYIRNSLPNEAKTKTVSVKGQNVHIFPSGAYYETYMNGSDKPFYVHSPRVPYWMTK